jgi:hypothetical protein
MKDSACLFMVVLLVLVWLVQKGDCLRVSISLVFSMGSSLRSFWIWYVTNAGKSVVVLFVSPQINHIKTRQVFDFYLIDSPGPANQDKV